MAIRKTITKGEPRFILTSPYTGKDSKFRWTAARSDPKEITFDFTDIPENARIISVTATLSNHTTIQGGNWGKAVNVTIRETGESPIPAYSNERAKAMLENGIRKIKIWCTVLGDTTDPYVPKPADVKEQWNEGAYITVEYEIDKAPVADGYTVKYAINGGWQTCFVFYGIDGKWQQCQVYYGTDGAWHETNHSN